MADQLISPVPDNAPELPKRRGIKTDSGWINYDITHYWAYHSRIGEILGYTVRYETPEGKYDFYIPKGNELLKVNFYRKDSGNLPEIYRKLKSFSANIYKGFMTCFRLGCCFGVFQEDCFLRKLIIEQQKFFL